MSLIVTTSQDGEGQMATALALAAELSATALPREGLPLAELQARHNPDGILVVEKNRIVYHGRDGGTFFFHPSLSVLRIQKLRRGEKDTLLEAAEVRPGDRILDGTLGLAADAIVFAWQTGPAGRVTGLESSPVLRALASRGLKKGWPEDPELSEAMGRIEVVGADHRTYLLTLPTGSYDVVYLDPMFRRPHGKSSALRSLEPLSDPRPVEREVIEEAQRIATRWVILKENPRSGEFQRLGCPETFGSPHAPAVFGRWPGKGGQP